MFCSSSHPNCSPHQFWEVFVFLSECLRTNNVRCGKSSSPIGRFHVPVVKEAAECRLG